MNTGFQTLKRHRVHLSNNGTRRVGPGSLGVTRWSMGDASPGIAPDGVGARVATKLPLLGSEIWKAAGFVFWLHVESKIDEHRF